MPSTSVTQAIPKPKTSPPFSIYQLNGAPHEHDLIHDVVNRVWKFSGEFGIDPARHMAAIWALYNAKDQRLGLFAVEEGGKLTGHYYAQLIVFQLEYCQWGRE